MSTLSLRLSDSLHKQVKLLAQKEGFSINQFISSAVAEKVAALATESYLAERAQKGDVEDFRKAMSSVADIEPSEDDKL